MDEVKGFFREGAQFFEEHGAGFTAAEIAQQPRLWVELGTQMAARADEIAAFLARAKERRVIFTGAGSSAFIGDALAPLIAKDFGLRAESIPTTELVSAPHSFLFADVPTLLVSFARSGNSPESFGALEYARGIVTDLYEVAITCDGSARLAELTAASETSLLLVMPEGSNDRGFAMTSSVSCMMLAGYLLLAGDARAGITDDIAGLARNLNAAAWSLSEAAARCAAWNFDRIAYLGSGFLKHIAHEASLKMMELTNGTVNGTFESATGFRHGPKSMIKDTTLTVHLISPDPFTARYDIDLLREVCGQKKQNQIVAIAAADAGELAGDEVVRVAPRTRDICAGLEMLAFCQMLALYKSLALGVATDDPSPTGEVNRVVKGVTIYPLTERA
ncbi:MAG: SIS domain-containing protein [Actinomycetia bacterium]|nr:SIS domain-containing protein [Actinomycetes bacterium]